MTTYFTTLNTESGRNPLDTNPCKLLDFQLVELSDGQTYSASSGDREVLAVIFGGKATINAGASASSKSAGAPTSSPENRTASTSPAARITR